MRVVEPDKFTNTTPKKSRRKSPLLSLVVVLVVVVAVVGAGVSMLGYGFDSPIEDELNIDLTSSIEKDESPRPINETDDTPQSTGELRIFSGNEFRLFYDNLLQPNLQPIGVPPTISGNDIADARIRQIAEQRGYRLRANPIVELPSVQGYRLHAVVHQPWLDLQATANQQGISMSIVSAHRSVADQRVLFTQRLRAEGVDIDDVAAGIADDEIDRVLITSSIPGYSKHHTGYTFDLACAGYAFENFGASPCYDWLAANNYEHAKTFGFIPSYPPDADLQGPDPEAWEYVYVGADLLRM